MALDASTQAVFDALNSTSFGIWPFCDLHTNCDLHFASIEYFPSFSGNIIFAGVFALLALVQVIQGIRYKTWSFLFLILPGLLLEFMGYGARIGLHYNPFLKNQFLLYVPLMPFDSNMKVQRELTVPL